MYQQAQDMEHKPEITQAAKYIFTITRLIRTAWKGQFASNNGAAPVTLTLNYFYTGTNLDSTVNRNNGGKLIDVKYFTDGNQTI